jgi:cell division topological specificity factor
LLAHERRGADQPELLNLLREEILAVIAKHLQFDREKVLIKLDRGRSVCTLDVDIELPNSFDAASKAI